VEHHALVVVLHYSEFEHLAGELLPCDVQLSLELDDFIGGIYVVAFRLHLLPHPLFTPHHQLSNFFHV
jgi:hypothetical protein